MNLIRHTLLQHLVFWLLSWFILLNHFQASSELAPTDYIFTAIFLFFLLIAVYTNRAVVSKLEKDLNSIYWSALSAMGIVVVFTVVLVQGFDPLVELFFPDYYLISYFDYFTTSKYFIIFIGLTMLIHYSQSWFRLREAETKVNKLEKEKLNSELNTLRNQVNPHFLFNSLNSIYALVLSQSDDAPEAVLKLSDALRYVIYEANEKRVKLSNELDFLNQYIGLQRMRLRKGDRLEVKSHIEDNDSVIAPLLLITLVENCFKHGFGKKDGTSYATIEITASKTLLKLKTENNISPDSATSSIGGNGLKTLRQRLNAEYSNRYSLNLDNRENIFTAELEIQL